MEALRLLQQQLEARTEGIRRGDQIRAVEGELPCRSLRALGKRWEEIPQLFSSSALQPIVGVTHWSILPESQLAREPRENSL